MTQGADVGLKGEADAMLASYKVLIEPLVCKRVASGHHVTTLVTSSRVDPALQSG